MHTKAPSHRQGFFIAWDMGNEPVIERTGTKTDCEKETSDMSAKFLFSTCLLALTGCANSLEAGWGRLSDDLDQHLMQDVTVKGQLSWSYSGISIYEPSDNGISLGLLDVSRAEAESLGKNTLVEVKGRLVNRDCENYIRCGYYIEVTSIGTITK